MGIKGRLERSSERKQGCGGGGGAWVARAHLDVLPEEAEDGVCGDHHAGRRAVLMGDGSRMGLRRSGRPKPRLASSASPLGEKIGR